MNRTSTIQPADIPETSTTLLRDLAQDSQHARWGEFVARSQVRTSVRSRRQYASMPPIIEMCDAHIHVGRYYRMTNAEVFDRRDFYYEPKIVAEVLKRCDVDEFIYSSISCQRHVTIAEVEREARETQAAFGPGAHPFYWVTGPFYDDDPDIKILDKGLFESVKIHGLETPWVKDRSKDLDRILSVLEERDVPVQFHSGDMFKPAEHFCKVAAINHEVVDEKQRQMIEAAKRGLV